MSLGVLIAVTHLLGAGHLTRAAAIGRAFARAGHRVTLVSGGMPASLVQLDGLRLVQLPPVRAAIGDFTTLRDERGEPATPERLEARRLGLVEAARVAQPDVVLTELYPFGRRVLAAEFGALLDVVRAARPRPLLAASIRDVLAPPGRLEKATATHDLLSREYDVVLVHGEPTFLPLDASWPVDAGLRPRLAYTGYVGPEPDTGDRAAATSPAVGGEVLVAGGSSAAAVPLFHAALGAAQQDGRRWRILVGAGVSDPVLTELARGVPERVTIERARPDIRNLMANATVFIGQAGYNTVMDVAATQVRSVLVPFEAGRETEQRLRAEHVAARGAAIVLRETDLDPASLAGAVEAAGRLPRPDWSDLRLDGAERTVRIVEDLVATRSAQARRSA